MPVKHSTKIIPLFGPVYLDQYYGLSGVSSLQELTSQLMVPAFIIISLGVFFYLVIGGYKFLTSGGDKNAVESARRMITHALIAGLLIIFIFLIIKLLPEILGTPSLNIIP